MKLWETEAGQANALVERFTAGEDARLDQALLYYDLCASTAHARGLARIGLLGDDDLARLTDALRALWAEGLMIHPEDEDVHTAVENALVARLGALGERLHTGRSRNDQVAVDLRMLAKERLGGIALAALDLAAALGALAAQHASVPMPGTTHTRAAMLSSVGLWAASFADALLETLVPLDAAYRTVDRSPLGAAAGYGAPLPLDRAYVAELLGFAFVQLNPLNAVVSRGRADYAVLSALAGIGLELSRLSADLIWYSSEAYGFFALPAAFCTGSSIMPNKHNPDALELVRARAARLQGNASNAFAVTQGRVSGYHRDHQELKPLLLDGLGTAQRCLEVLTPLVRGVEVDENRLRASLPREAFAVDAMLERVKAGTPMRQAYREVKAALDAIDAPDVAEALRARDHLGGTGNLGLDQLAERIETERNAWRAREAHLQERLTALVPRERAETK